MPRHRGQTEKSYSKSSRNRHSQPQPRGSVTESPRREDRVYIATIARPHGIRGALVVQAAGCAAALQPGMSIVVEALGDDQEHFATRIERSSPYRAGALIELEGISTREAAQTLVGHRLTTTRKALADPPPGEYYTCDVMGLSAYSKDGEPLGSVADIIETGANDVWVIKNAARELLVPATVHAVLEVDFARQRIVVDPTAAESEEAVPTSRKKKATPRRRASQQRKP